MFREDYVELSCSPIEEDCAQVGSDDYHARARKECQVFKDQLARQFHPLPDGVRLGIKSFPHDFGNYYEVVAYYVEDNEEATDFAWSMQDNLPEKWDDIARKELGL